MAQVRAFAAAAAREDRRRELAHEASMAVAVRMGTAADANNWKQYLKSLEP